MKLVLVPAGQFQMGTSQSDEKELLRLFPGVPAHNFAPERPAHTVRITKPFYLGQYEVTVGQFRQFAQAENYRTDGERDGEDGWGYNSEWNELEGNRPQ